MDQDWKHVKIDGIPPIDKCVAEFNVWERDYYPYSKFKIKIFALVNGRFEGYSNLEVKDQLGSSYCSVGYGATIEEALIDTIQYFFEMASWKDKSEWKEDDFIRPDPFDF
jgi:hypothetical protein